MSLRRRSAFVMAFLVLISAGVCTGEFLFQVLSLWGNRLDADTWDILAPPTMGYEDQIRSSRLYGSSLLLDSYCGIALKDEKLAGWQRIRDVEVDAFVYEENYLDTVLGDGTGREVVFRVSRSDGFPSGVFFRPGERPPVRAFVPPPGPNGAPLHGSDRYRISMKIGEDQLVCHVNGTMAATVEAPGLELRSLRFSVGYLPAALLSVEIRGTSAGGTDAGEATFSADFGPRGATASLRFALSVACCGVLMLAWWAWGRLLKYRFPGSRDRMFLRGTWVFLPLCLLPLAFQPVNLRRSAAFELNPFRFMPYPTWFLAVLGLIAAAAVLDFLRLRRIFPQPSPPPHPPHPRHAPSYFSA